MSRNAEQNKKIHDERREKILHHALRLFSSKGLHATKISDIAEKAEMSHGLLYHYFRSKEEIFTELVRDAFEKMNSAAKGLEASDMSPREKIRLAIIQLLRDIEEHEDFACTIMLIAQAGVSEATPEEARTIIHKESSVPYEVMERIFRAGQLDGSIRLHDARELSLVFWTAIKGLALHKAVFGSDFKSPDPQVLMDMFFLQD